MFVTASASVLSPVGVGGDVGVPVLVQVSLTQEHGAAPHEGTPVNQSTGERWSALDSPVQSCWRGKLSTCLQL